MDKDERRARFEERQHWHDVDAQKRKAKKAESDRAGRIRNALDGVREQYARDCDIEN